MPRLEFDAGAHIYRLDGHRVPSVTGIIRISGLASAFSFDDPIHKFRGHSVHFGCALLDQHQDAYFGVDGIPQTHPQYAQYVQVAHDINYGYLPGYAAFKAHTGFQGYIYECGWIHPLLRYGGIFDIAGECGEEVWLLDEKSGVLPELVPIQLAGYDMLIRQGLPIDPEHPGLDWLREVIKQGRKIHRKALRLSKDGTWTLFSETSKRTAYNDRKFDVAWASAISLYNIRSEYNFL